MTKPRVEVVDLDDDGARVLDRPCQHGPPVREPLGERVQRDDVELAPARSGMIA